MQRFLLALALLQPSAWAALQVSQPSDYQVFQRDGRGGAPCVVQGKVDGPCRSIVVAVAGVKAEGRPGADGAFRIPLRLPAGGWHSLQVEAVRESAGERVDVAHVGAGEVFVVAGQSNAANYGSERTSTASGRVSSWDGRAWRLSQDPQPGAGGAGGSFLPAFGDALVKRFDVPVGLVPLAVGATSVREWLPKGIRFAEQPTTGRNVRAVGEGEFESTGELFQKLVVPMEQLGFAGFRAVLWHQGESDAGQAREGHPADRQITGAQYAEFLEKLIRASRQRARWPVPWFTALATYHSEVDAADPEFRAAQQSLWAKGVSWPGPDTDALRAEYRAGVHFNAQGLARHGELWSHCVGDWLENELAEVRAGPPAADYQLVWSDEFAGKEIDRSKWNNYLDGQKRKDGVCDASCAELDGQGNLVISVKQVGDSYHTAMLTTQGRWETTYGYFECRVKVQSEEGFSSAFWLQSPAIAAPDLGLGVPDGTDRNGAEVDIYEYIRPMGEVLHHNLHWNGYKIFHQSNPADTVVPGLHSGFQVVGCEWTDSGYTFSVNGRKAWRTSSAVSKRPQFLLCSAEVLKWGGDITRAKLPATLSFDYVRVYQTPAQQTAAAEIAAKTPPPVAKQHPPLPQRVESVWNGFQRFDFGVAGHPGWLILPRQAAPGRPWIWRTEFFGHEPQADLALLEKGWHVAYTNVTNQYGAPIATDHMLVFQEAMVKQFQLHPRVVLEGFSRGGLFALNYAALHPDRVASLYLDAPVCDFKSWPAGFGKSKGSPRDWNWCKMAYGLSNDRQARDYRLNPVDNLAALAAAKVPILCVVGDADQVVPLAENSALLKERYDKLGGPIEMIVKPGCDHHPHSLPDPAPIVDFILKHAPQPSTGG